MQFLDDHDEIKILLPAHKIPDGSIVTKPTGEKEYTLSTNLKFFSNNKGECNKYNITAEKGTLMLINNDNINIINENAILAWVTSFPALHDEFERDLDNWK